MCVGCFGWLLLVLTFAIYPLFSSPLYRLCGWGHHSLHILYQVMYLYTDYIRDSIFIIYNEPGPIPLYRLCVGGFMPYIYCTTCYTCTQITYGTLFIIYNEPGGTPLYRLCVRVHFIIYNEPWGHTLIQSPKQPTPT